jgi:hypothetical protein
MANQWMRETRDAVRAYCLPSIRSAVSSLGGLCVIGLVLGCGQAPIKFVPVRGKVLVEGQSVNSGTVSFRPDADRGNQSMEQPAGMPQADGSFELATPNRKGAPLGWYRVLIMADNFLAVDHPEGFKPLVNDRYLYFNQTDILVEVKEESEYYVLRLNP